MSLFRRVLLRHEWSSVPSALAFSTVRAVQAQTAPVVVSRNKIQAVLDSKQYSYTLGNTSFVLQCPFCQRGAESDSCMFVNYTTGSVVCKPCAVRGTWSDFLKWSADGKSPTQLTISGVLSGDSKNSELAQMSSTEHAQKVLSDAVRWKATSAETTTRLREKLGINVLTDWVLDKYSVHTTTEGGSQCVALPWYKGDKLVGVRLVTGEQESTPHNSVCGVFGWSSIRPEHKELILTAGEFEAIAVHQSTGLPAVALSDPTALPSPMFSQFNQFRKVYLWLGSSSLAKQSAAHIASKVGLKKCYLVNSQAKTPLDILTNEGDLKELIMQAKRLAHNQILSFNELRGDVYGELSNREVVSGIKWQRFPQLTSILKGHRPGELTVFTGPTGQGKTTLLGELSLDLCMQGVATLWGNFEIKNVRLAKVLLKQYSGVNMEKQLHEYDDWADKFQQLPLYFMGFHGSADIGTVIETMTHAVYVHNIQHVIVDNLQFMLSSTNVLDRYSAQNQAIAALRSFASTEDVHVTVVIHPRKEDDTNPLTTASIFGTAKATQEADNVLILQCPHGKDKYLQVTKNRFDGDLGRVSLNWDKETCTMSGRFRTSPQSSTPDGKTLSASFRRTPSANTRENTANVVNMYRPQGSKFIGRLHKPVGTNGVPLYNQANRSGDQPTTWN